MGTNKALIKKAMDASIEIAHEAGNFLLSQQKHVSHLKISHKKAQGIYSEVDVKSESLIIKKINQYFPGHHILGEESSYSKYKGKNPSFEEFKNLPLCWVIDPLDGTNNYVNGFDYFGVSISLMSFGETIMGVIYRPHTGDCYFAGLGLGAKKKNLYHPNKKTKVLGKEKGSFCKNPKKFKDGIISECFARVDEPGLKALIKVAYEARGIRRMGSAVLDFAHLAEGIWDGLMGQGLAPWDMASGDIICREAGVKLTDFSGKAFNCFSRSIIGARGPFFSKFKKIL